MNIRSINRFQAAGGHLLISCVIGALSAVLVFFLWYPQALAVAGGVTKIFLILLLVDVCLGPLITLVIFNPQKKELKRDLAIVAMLQLAALFYGLHTVGSGRPVYVVFAVDSFDIAFADELGKEKLAKVKDPVFKSLPLIGTRVVAALPPSDPKENAEFVAGIFSGAGELHQLPQLYVRYETQKDAVLKHARPLEELKKYNPQNEAKVEALISKYASKNIEASFLPLRGGKENVAVVVDRKSAEVVEIVDLQPF